MKSAIVVTGAQKEAVKFVTQSIVAILSLDKCGDEAKIQGLKTLAALSKTPNLSINNCVFNSTAKKR